MSAVEYYITCNETKSASEHVAFGHMVRLFIDDYNLTTNLFQSFLPEQYKNGTDLDELYVNYCENGENKKLSKSDFKRKTKRWISEVEKAEFSQFIQNVAILIEDKDYINYLFTKYHNSHQNTYSFAKFVTEYYKYVKTF
jgi:hypothetical protein